jgi:cyclin G-associated kinase
MFNLDPRSRPPIDEIVFHLENIASTKSISLTERLEFLSSTLKSFSPTPQQVSTAQTSSSEAQKWIGNATNLFKSGFKTVKEASTKVIDQVVQQTMSGKIEFDICELTSRIVIIPNATLEGLESDLVKDQLLDHKPFHCVYNFTSKTYRKEKFCKLIEINGLTSKKAPQMSLLLKLCANIFKYLNDNPKNIIILHDNDGKSISALIACSFFILTGCFDQLDSPLSLFAVKRCGHNLSQSQLRYLKYVLQLSIDPSFLPLKNEFNLNTITLSSVPMFNRNKNGCTPYIEVYMKEQRIFTNYQEYDLLKKYTLNDGKISINVNCRLYGDITIVLYHARSLLGTGKVRKRLLLFYYNKILSKFNLYEGYL